MACNNNMQQQLAIDPFLDLLLDRINCWADELAIANTRSLNGISLRNALRAYLSLWLTLPQESRHLLCWTA